MSRRFITVLDFSRYETWNIILKVAQKVEPKLVLESTSTFACSILKKLRS